MVVISILGNQGTPVYDHDQQSQLSSISETPDQEILSFVELFSMVPTQLW